MAYTRTQRFESGTFLRPCDICGIRYRANQLVRGEDGFWRCRATCQEVPAITRDKISAQSQQRREAPPPPHGIPYDQRDTYGAEARVFDLLVTRSIVDANWTGGRRAGLPPSDLGTAFGHIPVTSTGGYTFACAGETCRYLYDLISENRRPSRWITGAQAKLRELGDWLLTKQDTTGNQTTSLTYGGFAGGAAAAGVYLCSETAQAALGLLFAYLALGDFKYLNGARIAAHFIRAFQYTAYAATVPTTSDAGGTARLYTGGHSETLKSDGSGLVFDSVFYASTGLLATEFLQRLKVADADSTYGGVGFTRGGNAFIQTSAATLSTMVTDSVAFWASGVLDSSTGTVITGVSATTPREYFNAYPATKTPYAAGSGAWEFQDGGATTGTKLTGQLVALALRSLYYLSGYSTQLGSVWTWLMAFSSNPTYVASGGSLVTDYPVTSTTKAANPPAPPAGQGNVVAAAYNPKLALSEFLLVRDAAHAYGAISQNGDGSGVSLYDWSTTGLLAAIQASRDAGSFRKAKDALTADRLQTPATFLAGGDYAAEDVPILRGWSGLGFQLDGAVTGKGARWSATRAAQAASAFRYQPQSWTGTGRPDTTQPGAVPGLQV